MPEGHTIHRLARDMSELEGTAVHASSPQGRFTDGAAIVDGEVLEQVQAHGKHLLLHFSSDHAVHVHLGMQGKWFRYADVSVPPLPQVRLRLAGERVAWDLVAPSKCEVLDSAAVTALLSRLGPDPSEPTRTSRARCRPCVARGGRSGRSCLIKLLSPESATSSGARCCMPSASRRRVPRRR